MTLTIVFIVIFGLGPVLFWLGLRQTNKIARLRVLVVAPFVLGLLGLLAKQYAGSLWGQDLGATLPGITLVWLGWIAAMVLGAACILPAMKTIRAQKWTRALGAVGTTMPWFGLATAQMVVG